MKIKEGFLLKEVAGSYLVVPVGAELIDFSKMITTNETGAFLWSLLLEDSTEDALIEKLCESYHVSKTEALTDVQDFIKILAEEQVFVS